jgi:hypothetical protein
MKILWTVVIAFGEAHFPEVFKGLTSPSSFAPYQSRGFMEEKVVDLPLHYLTPWLSTHATLDKPLEVSTLMYLRDSHVNQNYQYKPSSSTVRVFVPEGLPERFQMSSGRHLLATLFTEPFFKWLFSLLTVNDLTARVLAHDNCMVSTFGKLGMSVSPYCTMCLTCVLGTL